MRLREAKHFPEVSESWDANPSLSAPNSYPDALSASLSCFGIYFLICEIEAAECSL
jgi:hypothetical protein